MSRFFKGQSATSIVKGSNRKQTNWAGYLEKNHSIAWLIEHAVTVEMLEDVLKFAAYQTNASTDTRRRWAAEADKRLFVLKRRPPTYERIPFAEFREDWNKHVLASDGDKSALLIGKGSGFEEVRRGVLLSLPESTPAKDINFLAVEKKGPIMAPRTADIQALIDAAEMPNPQYSPEFRLAMIEKGRLAKYSDGKTYGMTASMTVTEMRILVRRSKCPPLPVPGIPPSAMDSQECIYNEWDVKFFCGETDITKVVVTESHPDSLRQSNTTPGAALFFGTHHDGVVPAKWKMSIEQLTGRTIQYNADGCVTIPAGQQVEERATAAIRKLNETLDKLDDTNPASIL